MDTIDPAAVQRVADRLRHSLRRPAIIHTITIQLNGHHGGMDVIVEGFDPYPEQFTDTTEVH